MRTMNKTREPMLLIEPQGIEITVKIVLTAVSNLLIEPQGIEISILHQEVRK